MEKKKWTLINSENVESYVCDETYSSKQLMGDEIAGLPVININEGVLKAGCRTGGGVHEDTEIYYVVKGSGILWLDEDSISVKPGDFIVIPPQTFHWIDNTMNDKDFVLYTFWADEKQNDVYFMRKENWGTSIRYKDEDYVAKRMEK